MTSRQPLPGHGPAMGSAALLAMNSQSLEQEIANEGRPPRCGHTSAPRSLPGGRAPTAAAGGRTCSAGSRHAEHAFGGRYGQSDGAPPTIAPPPVTFNPFAPSPACAVDTATGKPATVAPTTPPATYFAGGGFPRRWRARGRANFGPHGCSRARSTRAGYTRTPLIDRRRSDSLPKKAQRHAACVFGGQKGKPLLSWRVAILPYLGHERLYKRFHLDEPWDSLHNRELVSLMPEVYQNPGYRAYYTPGKGGEQSSEKPSRTPFLLLRGAKTFYADPTPAMPRMYEGWLKPIVIVVSRCRAVPWTKPEEYVYDAKDPRRWGWHRRMVKTSYCRPAAPRGSFLRHR